MQPFPVLSIVWAQVIKKNEFILAGCTNNDSVYFLLEIFLSTTTYSSGVNASAAFLFNSADDMIAVDYYAHVVRKFTSTGKANILHFMRHCSHVIPWKKHTHAQEKKKKKLYNSAIKLYFVTYLCYQE